MQATPTPAHTERAACAALLNPPAERPLICPLPAMRQRQLAAVIERAQDECATDVTPICMLIDGLRDTLGGYDLAALLGSVHRLIERSSNLRNAVGHTDLDLPYSILALDERIAHAEYVEEDETEAVHG